MIADLDTHLTALYVELTDRIIPSSGSDRSGPGRPPEVTDATAAGAPPGSGPGSCSGCWPRVRSIVLLAGTGERDGGRTRGPYAVVRHPVYAAYMLIQCGYILQAVSVRNIAVLAVATGCNAGRAICEERVLAERSDYAAYRKRVRRRLLPGVW